MKIYIKASQDSVSKLEREVLAPLDDFGIDYGSLTPLPKFSNRKITATYENTSFDSVQLFIQYRPPYDYEDVETITSYLQLLTEFLSRLPEIESSIDEKYHSIEIDYAILADSLISKCSLISDDSSSSTYVHIDKYLMESDVEGAVGAVISIGGKNELYDSIGSVVSNCSPYVEYKQSDDGYLVSWRIEDTQYTVPRVHGWFYIVNPEDVSLIPIIDECFESFLDSQNSFRNLGYTDFEFRIRQTWCESELNEYDARRKNFKSNELSESGIRSIFSKAIGFLTSKNSNKNKSWPKELTFNDEPGLGDQVADALADAENKLGIWGEPSVQGNQGSVVYYTQDGDDYIGEQDYQEQCQDMQDIYYNSSSRANCIEDMVNYLEDLLDI